MACSFSLSGQSLLALCKVIVQPRTALSLFFITITLPSQIIRSLQGDVQLLWFSYVSCRLQSGPPEFLRNTWSVNWRCPRRKEVSSYLEKIHPSSILWDMKRKCCLGELSSALEGMWRIYSESKGCSLMSERSSIWLHLQRATLSNIVAKLYLLLNASETKPLSKPEKKISHSYTGLSSDSYIQKRL